MKSAITPLIAQSICGDDYLCVCGAFVAAIVCFVDFACGINGAIGAVWVFF